MKKDHRKKTKSKVLLFVLGALALLAARQRISARLEIDDRESELGGFDDNY